MKMSDVVALLVSLNVKPEPGPQGVLFSWYFNEEHQRRRFRVESGSGIAGRGGAWNVVRLPTGAPLGPKVFARNALRRQILEALAEGAKPDAREGYEVYARWHTAQASSVQWFQRRKRRRWPENKNEQHLERACLLRGDPACVLQTPTRRSRARTSPRARARRAARAGCRW